jgi:hypothetical protein
MTMLALKAFIANVRSPGMSSGIISAHGLKDPTILGKPNIVSAQPELLDEG